MVRVGSAEGIRMHSKDIACPGCGVVGALERVRTQRTINPFTVDTTQDDSHAYAAVEDAKTDKGEDFDWGDCERSEIECGECGETFDDADVLAAAKASTTRPATLTSTRRRRTMTVPAMAPIDPRD